MGIADGYAQASGGLAAVNVHVQPGLANAMSGILNAARARVPLLVTVGQQVQDAAAGGALPGRGAGGAGAAPGEGGLGGHARRGPPAPAGARAAHGPRAAERAGGAEPPAGRPGRARPPAPRAAAARRRPPPPDAASLDRGRRAAGRGAAPRPCWPATRWPAPARRTSWRPWPSAWGRRSWGSPSAATVPLPTDHPLWRGPLPAFASEIAPLLAPHDVVLAVGMPVFRLFGVSPGRALPPGTALVHLEVDPHEVGRVHAPAAGLVGDVRLGLAGLRERLGPPPAEARGAARPRPSRRWPPRRAAARARVEAAGAGRAGGRPPRSPAPWRTSWGRDDLVVDEALTAGRGLRAVIGAAHARPPGWPTAAAPSAGGSRPPWARRWPIRGAA